jgi:hypothetical protein
MSVFNTFLQHFQHVAEHSNNSHLKVYSIRWNSIKNQMEYWSINCLQYVCEVNGNVKELNKYWTTIPHGTKVNYQNYGSINSETRGFDLVAAELFVPYLLQKYEAAKKEYEIARGLRYTPSSNILTMAKSPVNATETAESEPTGETAKATIPVVNTSPPQSSSLPLSTPPQSSLPFIDPTPIDISETEIAEVYQFDELYRFEREELPSIIGFTIYDRFSILFVTKSMNIFSMDKGVCPEFWNYSNNGELIFNKEKFAEFVKYDNSLPPIPKVVYEKLNILKSYCKECLQNIFDFNGKYYPCASSSRCKFIVDCRMINVVTEKNRKQIFADYSCYPDAKYNTITKIDGEHKPKRGYILNLYSSSSLSTIRLQIREPLQQFITDSFMIGAMSRPHPHQQLDQQPMVTTQATPAKPVESTTQIENETQKLKDELKSVQEEFDNYKRENELRFEEQQTAIKKERDEIAQLTEIFLVRNKDLKDKLAKYQSIDKVPGLLTKLTKLTEKWKPSDKSQLQQTKIEIDQLLVEIKMIFGENN